LITPPPRPLDRTFAPHLALLGHWKPPVLLVQVWLWGGLLAGEGTPSIEPQHCWRVCKPVRRASCTSPPSHTLIGAPLAPQTRDALGCARRSVQDAAWLCPRPPCSWAAAALLVPRSTPSRPAQRARSTTPHGRVFATPQPRWRGPAGGEGGALSTCSAVGIRTLQPLAPSCTRAASRGPARIKEDGMVGSSALEVAAQVQAAVTALDARAPHACPQATFGS
jgi:hypothetical protein